MNLTIRSISFAAKAHETQYRKATDIPYIAHPYTVGMLLKEAGCKDEVVAAGILHDVVEDSECTLDQIEVEFGAVVANIVKGCSEPDKSLPWEARKEHTITFLKQASLEVKLVACADKLHNLMSTYHAILADGELVWDRFKRGKEQQEWYYRNVLASIKENLDQEYPLVKELESHVKKVFG